MLFLRSLGGAFGDVPQERTAFPARDATWFAMAGAFDIPGLVHDEQPAADPGRVGRHRGARVRRCTATSRPSTDPGLVSRMYPPETMARLAAVKREWDPQNLFCRNHNVLPA